jgi:hypothetical protein
MYYDKNDLMKQNKFGYGKGFCGMGLRARFRQIWGNMNYQHGGRGYRHWFYATGLPGWLRNFRSCFFWRNAPQLDANDEANILKERVKVLQEEIDTLNEYIKNLEQKSTK